MSDHKTDHNGNPVLVEEVNWRTYETTLTPDQYATICDLYREPQFRGLQGTRAAEYVRLRRIGNNPDEARMKLPTMVKSGVPVADRLDFLKDSLRKIGLGVVARKGEA